MILRAGLAVVDHISQSMHYEDMLSWLLFYTSLLDLRKMPQVDITDPGGIVRSQVVEAANGALRIALNASQIQRTQSSRFLDEYFGSGVQHIAFASNALVDTVAKLKANSVAILPFRKLLRRSRRSSRFIPRITRCLEGQQHAKTIPGNISKFIRSRSKICSLSRSLSVVTTRGTRPSMLQFGSMRKRVLPENRLDEA